MELGLSRALEGVPLAAPLFSLEPRQELALERVWREGPLVLKPMARESPVSPPRERPDQPCGLPPDAVGTIFRILDRISRNRYAHPPARNYSRDIS
jgi:hypothetical protein